MDESSPDDAHQDRLAREKIEPSQHPKEILVLGATGYIGGRLVPRLLQAGHHVRAAARSVTKLENAPWRDQVEIHHVDLEDNEGLDEAMRGVDVVYLLVHAMGGGGDFEEREAESARRIAATAEREGVSRIIYLGGLHPEGVKLSPHMRSRAEVARILVESPVDTVAFQAGIIIGSGSASFEMIRHLALKLRLMPAPGWVQNNVEPLAIRDVLHYLLAASEYSGQINRILDIGSGDVMSYSKVMEEFSSMAGLKPRKVLPLPLPAATLSGIWVGLVTPLPMTLTIPLVRSLQNDAVTNNSDVDDYFPRPPAGLLNYSEAVSLALKREEEGSIDTTWDADIGPLEHSAGALPSDPDWAGLRRYEDVRTIETEKVSSRAVWEVIEAIGGTNGWHSWPLAWKVRGVWDKLVGGAGLNRGRRLPDTLRVGDPVDWWRVEKMEPGHRLLLRAEMKVSGYAWLEFSVDELEGGTVQLKQRALFYAKSIRGSLYWMSMAPFHRSIFPTMLENIIETARLNEQNETSADSAGVR